jgi:DNA mismatch repair ATPase MutS
MKTILAVIITVIIIGVAGYLFGPKLIMKESAPLRTEIAQLQSRLQAVEGFIKAEEEARQASGLKTDTRLPDVVRIVNRIASEQKSIEDVIQVRFADVDARLSEMKAATERGMGKLYRQTEEGQKSTEKSLQEWALRARVDDARIRILKIKSELAARNIGVAKGELDLFTQALDEAKKLTGDKNGKKEAIEKLKAMAKEIKTEMDGNIVAAMDRIDLLWHELTKLSVPG